MTDEYETKLLAEDWLLAATAAGFTSGDRFKRALENLRRWSVAASSLEARETFHDMANLLEDAQTAARALAERTAEAAHMKPSSRDLGEVCSKKKMGAVG